MTVQQRSTATVGGALPDGTPARQVIADEGLPGRSHRVAFTPILASRIDSFAELTVPSDHYFFMGDNRDQSRDSRLIGTAPLSDIYGRATHVAVSVDPDRYYLPRFERWLTKLQ